MNRDQEYEKNAEVYLHTNGTIILKRLGGVDVTSDFVKKCWKAKDIFKSPQIFLSWLKEVQSLGAKKQNIESLIRAAELDTFIPDCYEQLGL